MQVVVKRDAKEAGAYVAGMIAAEVRANPSLKMSLPTGSTPEETLAELVRMHKEEGLDFSQAYSYNMDEYVGLSREHEQGYYYFLNDLLYSHVNIDPSHTFAPDGCADDLERAVGDYTALIQDAGGFDFIFLGIGRDGHICFNMPSDSLRPNVHVEQLSEATINDNARFFDDPAEVPTRAITLGVKIILESKNIVLLATGEGKAPAIARLLGSDAVTPQLPASFLNLRDDAVIVLDEAAASEWRASQSVAQ